LAPLSYQLAQAGCTRNTDGRKTKIDVEDAVTAGRRVYEGVGRQQKRFGPLFFVPSTLGV